MAVNNWILLQERVPVPFPPSTAGNTTPPPPPSGSVVESASAAISKVYEELAGGLLNQSMDLMQNTSSSWNDVWEYAILDPQKNFLWDSLVDLGLKLAFFSVLYLAVTEGTSFIKNQDNSTIVNFFVWPLAIALLLGNNGYLMVQNFKIVNQIALGSVNEVYKAQINGLSMKESLLVTQATSIGIDAIEGILSNCTNKTHKELASCLEKQGTTAREVYAIIDEETTKNGTKKLSTLQSKFNIAALSDAASDAKNGNKPTISIKLLFTSIFSKNLKTLLYLIQWCFVNTLEISLLLSALVSPLALGLSLMPIQGRPIIGWLIGYLALWGIQIGYSIIVGLMAWVVVNSELEAIADVAFLFYLAIFAPSLATGIMTFSAMAIHQGVINNMDEIKDAISSALDLTTGVALKLAAA